MVKRVSMTIITEAKAADGKLRIRGSGRRGDIEFEFPGEAAQMLIAGVSALLPKLAKISPSGSKPSIQIGDWELKSTNDPDIATLHLRAALPPHSPPETERLTFVFSMSWAQIAEMGGRLAESARKTPPAPPRRAN